MAKYFTDGKGIFTVGKVSVVLVNLETGEKVETQIIDDTVKGFRAIELSPPAENPPVAEKPKSRIRLNAGRTRKNKYSGVSFHKASGKYRVQVYVNGINTYGGSFDDETEAARKADEMYIENRQEARNFPVVNAKIKLGEPVDEKNVIYSCRECGADYETKPDKCSKCGSNSFEKSPKV